LHRLIFCTVACVGILRVVQGHATEDLPDFSTLLPTQEVEKFQVNIETEFSIFKQRAKDGFVASTTRVTEQTFGMKYANDDKNNVSLEFSYLNLRTKDDAAPAGFAQGGRLDLQSYSFRLFSEFDLLGWTVKPSALLGSDTIRAQRRDVLSQATAFSKTTGLRTIADIEIYRNFPVAEKLILSPTVKLEHTYTFVKGFEETGAGLSNLQVGAVNDQRLRSQLGVTAIGLFPTAKGGLVAPFFTVKWLHNFITAPLKARTGLAVGGGSENVDLLAGPDANGALVNTGVFVKTSGNLEFLLGYEGEFFNSSNLHTVSAYMKIAF